MKDIKVIAVDADDTLWDNQSYYDRAGDVFSETLLEYGQVDWLQDRLFETEIANMPLLGYGAKSVCISMMETAMEVSGGKVSAAQLDHILKSAKSLLEIPATPCPVSPKPWRNSETPEDTASCCSPRATCSTSATR